MLSTAIVNFMNSAIYWLCKITLLLFGLTHLFPMHPFSTPWKQGIEDI